MGAPWKAIAAGVGTGITSTVTGFGDRDAAKEENKRKREMHRKLNDGNKAFFDESRGGGVQSPNGYVQARNALLPLHASINGRPAEQEMARQWARAYAETNKLTPYEHAAKNREQLMGLYHAQLDADNIVSGLHSGKMADKTLGDQAAVNASRLRQANLKRNAGVESIQQSLNELDAARSAKGFVGSGMADSRGRMAARGGSNLNAVNAVELARLQALTENRNIKSSYRNRQIANASLPARQAAQSLNLDNESINNLAHRQQVAQSPYAFLRMAPATFQESAPPEQELIPSTLGIIATGIGDGQTAFMNAMGGGSGGGGGQDAQQMQGMGKMFSSFGGSGGGGVTSGAGAAGGGSP